MSNEIKLDDTRKCKSPDCYNAPIKFKDYCPDCKHAINRRRKKGKKK